MNHSNSDKSGILAAQMDLARESKLHFFSLRENCVMWFDSTVSNDLDVLFGDNVTGWMNHGSWQKSTGW